MRPPKSSIMDSMSGLSPFKQSHVLNTRKLKDRALDYSKVVDNIEPVGGMDQIQVDIDWYVTLEKDLGYE